MTQILGVDYAWQHPDPTAVKRAGYSFVARYLSYDPSKNMTTTERDAVWAAGLGIVLVWEAGVQDVLGGAAQGDQEGAAAAQQAAALGFPKGYPIFFATDFDEPSNQFPTNAAYLRAAGNHGYVSGPYGSFALCQAMVGGGVTPFAWQTEAWSGSGVYPQANLYQRVNPTLPAIPGGGYDENVVIVPFPIWYQHSVAPKPPAPKPPAPQPHPPTNVPPAHRNIYTPLAVDGNFGPRSTEATQFVTFNGNTADCDGIFGINSKKSLQHHLGVASDGLVGPVTVKALQHKVGATVDGVWGLLTTEALQRALNDGRF